MGDEKLESLIDGISTEELGNKNLRSVSLTDVWKSSRIESLVRKESGRSVVLNFSWSSA